MNYALAIGNAVFSAFLFWALYLDLTQDLNGAMGTLWLTSTAGLTAVTAFWLLRVSQ